jgi:hypothetical protein
MMTAKKAKAISKADPAAKGNPNELRITKEKGKSQERQLAELGLSAPALNAITARTFTKGIAGEIDLTEAVLVMREKAGKVNVGDTSELEATLTAQAVSLDTIFNELARRAALNMGEYLQATESYMRLALKAQAQCARTIEVLAAIKNPPLVFAKQANIAHGHQQVNNAPARVENTKGENELLEDQHATVDTGATQAPSLANPELETVGALHGGENV